MKCGVVAVASLLLLTVEAGCATPRPSFERSGYAAPGATISILNKRGEIEVYPPRRDQASNQYTIEGYSETPGAADRYTFEVRPQLVRTSATGPGSVRYLIRAPKDSTLNLVTARGSITVEDFEGVANAQAGRGSITMLLPAYGNAAIGTGSMTVSFGSTDWKGTLHFSAQRGDVEVHVNAIAKAHVHLHTDNGSIYTDFPLLGSAQGQNETIDGAINGGAQRGIDVFVHSGSIRLLQLKPQP